ncbi:MAG: hypothetical protein OQK82_08015 [Candidatus Pacearchaeota archaeon]|nr:hypothetical protein [Candidatus Pacearchaeota archaeon]
MCWQLWCYRGLDHAKINAGRNMSNEDEKVIKMVADVLSEVIMNLADKISELNELTRESE